MGHCEAPFDEACDSILTKLIAAAETKRLSSQDRVAACSWPSLQQRMIQLNVCYIAHQTDRTAKLFSATSGSTISITVAAAAPID